MLCSDSSRSELDDGGGSTPTGFIEYMNRYRHMIGYGQILLIFTDTKYEQIFKF